MQYTLGRKLTRLWMAFMTGALFCSVMLVFSPVFSIPVIVCLVIGVVLMLIANRCPHCGNGFRGGSWSKPHAGYCNKCGKLMEYDDTVAERERRRALKKD